MVDLLHPMFSYTIFLVLVAIVSMIVKLDSVWLVPLPTLLIKLWNLVSSLWILSAIVSHFFFVLVGFIFPNSTANNTNLVQNFGGRLGSVNASSALKFVIHFVGTFVLLINVEQLFLSLRFSIQATFTSLYTLVLLVIEVVTPLKSLSLVPLMCYML